MDEVELRFDYCLRRLASFITKFTLLLSSFVVANDLNWLCMKELLLFIEISLP